MSFFPNSGIFRFGRAAVCTLALAWHCGIAQAEPPEVQLVFRAQMALANFEVLNGRFVCRLERLTGWGNTISNKQGVEKLQFKNDERGNSMHYELKTATRRVKIDAWREELTMVRQVVQEGKVTATTRFEQRPGAPLRLEVIEGDVSQTIEGDTVWHLWLTDAQLCAENLLPMCELIGLEVPWTQFTQALETRLVQLADAGESHDQTEWRKWLDELSSPQFTVREAADRQLRAAGTSLLPFVRRLDLSLLDAEQRFRLRRIIYDLHSDVAADTVDSTADLLLDDPRVWVELLDREDEAARTAVAAQLRRTWQAEIEYDVAGSVDVRREQVARLRERVRGAFDRH
jgi:hypothetical protein